MSSSPHKGSRPVSGDAASSPLGHDQASIDSPCFLRGLWRGMVPLIAGQAPANANWDLPRSGPRLQPLACCCTCGCQIETSESGLSIFET